MPRRRQDPTLKLRKFIVENGRAAKDIGADEAIAEVERLRAVLLAIAEFHVGAPGDPDAPNAATAVEALKRIARDTRTGI